MIIFKYAADLIDHLRKKRSDSIGFVPTMGALHEGHLSLIKKSRECATVVSSLFVNPTQFNNPDDFSKYPNTIEKDIYLLEKNGCDILYLPDITEMYPNGTAPTEHFDLGYLETVLEGKFRPGHFQGVCQVVKRLMQVVAPTHLYLGQKDYQQCMVIQRLLEVEKMDSRVVIGETLREPDGLAMSSRNLRLSPQQRTQAPLIRQMLVRIKENISSGPLARLKEEAKATLQQNGFMVDYIEITGRQLQPLDTWDGKTKWVALAAASLGDIRLIDNILPDD